MLLGSSVASLLFLLGWPLPCLRRPGRSQSETGQSAAGLSQQNKGKVRGRLQGLEVKIPTCLDPRLLIPGHPRGKIGMSKLDSGSDFPYAGMILSSWLDG